MMDGNPALHEQVSVGRMSIKIPDDLKDLGEVLVGILEGVEN